ncbi:LytTR family transcriptional regulator DNA-binding domain-containing protein [Prauserella salsuginis]|uniref:LytTR family transcriptional regulator DNA-binding domain-containing protein n=1 Tax=Prauserella salsuginis TaxID=387889 RepID=A0ABW6GC22_9PSEU|nr:LytTR family transcriptional regulator DNA-binding domain-containing protein [Prauserella salsuginis]
MKATPDHLASGNRAADASGFLAVHRQYVVNLSRIHDIEHRINGELRLVMDDEANGRHSAPDDTAKPGDPAVAGSPDSSARQPRNLCTSHAQYMRPHVKQAGLPTHWIQGPHCTGSLCRARSPDS